MSNTEDWDSIPVKTAGKAKAASAAAASNTSDWDAVPIKPTGASASSDKPQSEVKQSFNRIVDAGNAMGRDIKSGNIAAPGIGVGETALNAATGLGSTVVGGLAGAGRFAYNLAAGEGLDKSADLATQTINKVQQAGTYQPRTAAGRLGSEVIAAPFVAARQAGTAAGGTIGEAINGQQGRIAGEAIGGVTPDVIATLAGGVGALKGVKPAPIARQPMPVLPAAPAVSDVPAYVRKAQADFEAAKAAGTAGKNPITPAGTTQTVPAAPVVPKPQSAGAAATTQAKQAEASGATPEVQSAIQQAEASGNIHDIAAQRHIEASSLPVPMRITKGQATGDVNQISFEQNSRGKFPEMAETFNSQNGQLVKNIEAIRDQAAPDVYHANHVESGQSLIDSYKAKDSALSADISAKYKALEDANGGQFPVDGQAFVAAAEQALSKKMKGRYVPPEIVADMDHIKNGGQMTYENFENMRTNLAAEARKAERSGDGNRAMATSLVRDALESIPITGETAVMKPLADAARSAAKARFDLIKNDPAYKAAVNDSTSADGFIQKFVVKAPVKNVQTMKANLAHDDLAGQTISAGTVNYLKDRAMGSGKNFNQSGFNNGLKELRPKLGDLVQPEQAAHLEALGNVARYTQEQPRGSYVNNSNTAVQQAAEAAKALATGALDVKTFGISKFARERMHRAKEQREINDSLKPGAGINLSDLPK